MFFLQIMCNSITWESQEVVKSYFLKNLSTKKYISDATTQCIKIRKNSHLFKPIIWKWKKFQENNFGSCRKFTGWSLNPDLSTKANFESNWTTQKILNFESTVIPCTMLCSSNKTKHKFSRVIIFPKK